MKKILVLLACILMVATSCRQDDYIVYAEEEEIKGDNTPGSIVGMYILNEGNMGSNKCTLDYLDLSATGGTLTYLRNIYAERNPGEVKELGDVGNDIEVYGSKLWMVINCSNKVEVADAATCRKLAKIDIPNCRYLTFHDAYAYISSYVGPVEVGGDARLGRVYKVDTLTMQKVDSITVGYQPDELCVVGNRMYVANSGGYLIGRYDRTVSEIDLATFRELRKIDVEINMHRCRSDRYGQVWVSSRGNYYGVAPTLSWLSADGGTMEKRGSLDVCVSDMCIVGDSLYFVGVSFSQATMQNTKCYGIVNVKTHQLVTQTLSSSPEIDDIELPYGIIVNPQHRDFYIMDAKNYISSGSLLHFGANGTFLWKVRTGDVPSQAAFVPGGEKEG